VGDYCSAQRVTIVAESKYVMLCCAACWCGWCGRREKMVKTRARARFRRCRVAVRDRPRREIDCRCSRSSAASSRGRGSYSAAGCYRAVPIMAAWSTNYHWLTERIRRCGRGVAIDQTGSVVITVASSVTWSRKVAGSQ